MQTLLADEFNSLHIEVISLQGCPGIGHLYKRTLCSVQAMRKSVKQWNITIFHYRLVTSSDLFIYWGHIKGGAAEILGLEVTDRPTENPEIRPVYSSGKWLINLINYINTHSKQNHQLNHSLNHSLTQCNSKLVTTNVLIPEKAEPPCYPKVRATWTHKAKYLQAKGMTKKAENMQNNEIRDFGRAITIQSLD